MATKEILIDDLTGEEAVYKVEFSIDGQAYVMDLSEGTKTAWDQALDPYVAAARPVNGQRPRKPRKQATPNPETAAIRQWWNSDLERPSVQRGRISKEVRLLWDGLSQDERQYWLNQVTAS